MSNRRNRPPNRCGCIPDEDVCVEHDLPLVCKHGCLMAAKHKCKELAEHAAAVKEFGSSSENASKTLTDRREKERREKERRVAHYTAMLDRAMFKAELDAIAQCYRLALERVEAVRAVLEVEDAGK